MSGSLNEFLKEIPFFQDLSAGEIDQISPLFVERVYKKGVTVFLEQDPAEELFIVKSGVVKIYRNVGDREVILAFFHEGDYFGEMGVLERERTRSASAQAIGNSVLHVLKRKDLIQVLEDNPKLLLKMLEIAMARIRKTNDLIKDLTTLDARSRIIQAIVRLSGEYGVKSEEGILIDLQLTHQQLADMTSTVRETVTKVLLDLQIQKLIEIHKKKITILDPETLMESID